MCCVSILKNTVLLIGYKNWALVKVFVPVPCCHPIMNNIIHLSLLILCVLHEEMFFFNVVLTCTPTTLHDEHCVMSFSGGLRYFMFLWGLSFVERRTKITQTLSQTYKQTHFSLITQTSPPSEPLSSVRSSPWLLSDTSTKVKGHFSSVKNRGPLIEAISP